MGPLLFIAILSITRFARAQNDVRLQLAANERDRITSLLEVAYDSIDEALTKMFILSQKNAEMEKHFTTAIVGLETRVKRLELILQQVAQEEQELVAQWTTTTENPKFPAVPTTTRPVSSTNRFAFRPYSTSQATTATTPSVATVTTPSTTVGVYPPTTPAGSRPTTHRVHHGNYVDCPTNIGNRTVCFNRRAIGFSCYCFVAIDYTWPRAEINCQVNNMNLVSVETESEERLLNALAKLANQELDSGNIWWWSSGSDQGPNGDWIWSATGQAVLEGYYNWRTDQVDILRDIRILLVFEGDTSVWDNWAKGSDWKSICEI